MTVDFSLIGFKAGLEIHQQLSGKKLFCDCPCEIRKDPPHFKIIRRLRASAGELGGVDEAASHEQKKAKLFTYHAYHDSTCLVELDEEPPHPANEDALMTCLKVCKMLHAEVGSHIQFMRKVVIDGSNTTGFQRTALVGRNGSITLKSGKRISIPTIFLEEEAAQPIKREKDHDTYNISRLGIPLLEIATGPDLSDPEETKEAAAMIGMILRSVPGMKRGIGTIRQDVNLSIKDGARVEVKGFQDYKAIPKVIEHEVSRQLSIIRQGKTPTQDVRVAKSDFTTAFMRPMPGAHRMYPETDIPIIAVDTEGITGSQTLAEREDSLVREFGINHDFAKMIVKNGIDFSRYVSVYPSVSPAFIAETLVNSPKEIKARYKKDIDIEKHIHVVFKKLNDGEIPRSAVFEILVEIAQGKTPDFSKYAGMSDHELERIVKETIKEHPDVSMSGIMGLVMQKVRGKAEGSKVMELLRKHMKT